VPKKDGAKTKKMVDKSPKRSYYNSISRSKRSAHQKKGKVKTNQDRKTSILKGWAEL
jgi:hypothetical protein